MKTGPKTGAQPISCFVCGNIELGPGWSAKTCYKCLANGLKYCGKCKTVKPISTFSHSSKYTDGYHCNCKDCKNQANKQTYNKHLADGTGKAYWASRNHARRTTLTGSFTAEQWQKCCNYFNQECAYCGSFEKLTVEHIIPVSKFGANKIYNIIPACPSCNYSKNDKDILDWYPKQPFYTEARLLKIHSWFKDMQKEVM